MFAVLPDLTKDPVKYKWHRWLDGEWHTLVRGKHYRTVRGLKAWAKEQAASKGLVLLTRTYRQGKRLAIRFEAE